MYFIESVTGNYFFPVVFPFLLSASSGFSRFFLVRLPHVSVLHLPSPPITSQQSHLLGIWFCLLLLLLLLPLLPASLRLHLRDRCNVDYWPNRRIGVAPSSCRRLTFPLDLLSPFFLFAGWKSYHYYSFCQLFNSCRCLTDIKNRSVLFCLGGEGLFRFKWIKSEWIFCNTEYWIDLKEAEMNLGFVADNQIDEGGTWWGRKGVTCVGVTACVCVCVCVCVYVC